MTQYKQIDSDSYNHTVQDAVAQIQDASTVKESYDKRWGPNHQKGAVKRLPYKVK